jgi:hypothetical protein
MLTTVDLFYLMMCENLREERFIDVAFGSQFHGHGFWLMREVALSYTTLLGNVYQFFIANVTKGLHLH